MLKRKLPLLFMSMVICLVLILSGCTPKTYQLSTSIVPSGSGSISPSGGPLQGKVTLIANPAQNYEFSGWAGAVSGNANPLTLTMNSDKQIVAQFKRLQSSVQVTSNPSDGGTVRPASGTYDAGTTMAFNVTPNSGYRFDHWGGSATGTSIQINLFMDTNKNITAYFTKQYALKVVSNPSEGGSINQGGGLLDAGTKINLTATQIFPYIFTNWTGTDNNNVYKTTVTMDSDKTVTCNFTKGIDGGWKAETFPVYRGGNRSYYIDLNQFEYAEGSITKGTSPASIQDPTGATIKDFGTVGQANFVVTALIGGQYTIVFYNNDQGALSQDYTVKYRIYKR